MGGKWSKLFIWLTDLHHSIYHNLTSNWTGKMIFNKGAQGILALELRLSWVVMFITTEIKFSAVKLQGYMLKSGTTFYRSNLAWTSVEFSCSSSLAS